MWWLLVVVVVVVVGCDVKGDRVATRRCPVEGSRG